MPISCFMPSPASRVSITPRHQTAFIFWFLFNLMKINYMSINIIKRIGKL